MAVIEGVILLLILLFFLHKWLTQTYDIFLNRNIPYERPKIILGNIDWRIFLKKSSIMRAIIRRYQHFKDKQVYGVFNFREPIVVIRDPQLIKTIGIKDFDHFKNHKSIIFNEEDNIFGKTLFALTDQVWKDMRTILSPSFTGSKMRLMFELIDDCCLEATKYIEQEIAANGKNEIDLEVKDLFTRFTNDTIATTAFGIRINSFESKKNDFYTIGRSLTRFNALMSLKFALFNIAPKLMKALNISLFEETKINFFYKLVRDAMEYRQKHNIVRPDMIQLLMEAKQKHQENEANQKNQHINFKDENLLLAQCFIFFLAGYETVSTCLSFTLYELLLHQDVQQHLYEEIVRTEKELDGKPLNYDTLMGMTYMGMVLSESLRKWPPVIATDRLCNSDFDLKDDNGNLITQIKKGDIIMFPIVGLHYDETYYENPYEFNPERFSENNKDHSSNPVYMPFGIGPRVCIGNRLALMETKYIIYRILLKFKVAPSDKTTKDMLTSIEGFQMQPKEGFWTKFILRNN